MNHADLFCKCCSLTPSKQGALHSSWGRDKGGYLFSGPPSKKMESLSITKGHLSLLHTLTIPQQTLHPTQPMEFFLLVLPPLWPELGCICEVNTIRVIKCCRNTAERCQANLPISSFPDLEALGRAEGRMLLETAYSCLNRQCLKERKEM